MINDLKDGDVMNGFYLVKSVSKSLSNTGISYLNIVLQDKTGTIDSKKWDSDEEDLVTFTAGNIVKIEGSVLDYKGHLQGKIFSAVRVDQSKANLESLLIESPIPVADLIKEYKFYLDSVGNADCKKILNAVFAKYYQKFIDYPAAVSNHHDFYHGLLFHTVSMCALAAQISKLYLDIDYDILITGCLLHDIGKVVEFNGPVATRYTDEGNLLGHISIGMSIVKEICSEQNITGEVPLLIEHMILSHHGKQEFGSPVLPETREALLLSMIDEMDSKMATLDKAYKNVGEGEYTDRIFAFDNRAFFKPHKHS